MPRKRRGVRERRPRKQLAADVWDWLSGRSEDELSEQTFWSVLALEAAPVRHRMDLEDFWDRVEQAVESGEIEIAGDIPHNIFEPPLLEELCHGKEE